MRCEGRGKREEERGMIAAKNETTGTTKTTGTTGTNGTNETTETSETAGTTGTTKTNGTAETELSQMSRSRMSCMSRVSRLCEGWKTVKLGEVCEFLNGKTKPVDTGIIPIYGSNGIIGYSNRFLYSNAIIVGRVGAYAGALARCKTKFWPTDNTIVVKPREQIADTDFIFYRMKKLSLSSLIGGSAQPLITQGILKSKEIPLPPLPTQRKIAAVLGALDDKIENNRKICANLEAQAQALFKSWFVDFEPFGGKMPDGWKMGKLGEVAEIVSGKRPPTRANEKDSENQYPLLGASCIMGFTSEFMYDEPILVTGRVGTHGIIQRSCEKCWPSDNTLVLKTEYYEFVYQQLLNIDYSLMNRGSTQPLITQSDLKGVSVIMPNEKILREYEERASVLMSMWLGKKVESRALAELRDALLPKLMSGELDVSEVAV